MAAMRSLLLVQLANRIQRAAYVCGGLLVGVAPVEFDVHLTGDEQ
ncbi:hypothetical protein ACGFIP_22570 [Micromonospora zamorensis]